MTSNLGTYKVKTWFLKVCSFQTLSLYRYGLYRARKQRYEDEARRHYYFMTLSSSETIDAAERGNAGRFLNHSVGGCTR